MLSLADIEALFARHGDEQYSGEPVTQLEHALQTAHLAEQHGAGDALVTACLLHDLGHLLNVWSPAHGDDGVQTADVTARGSAPPAARARPGDTPTLRGIDDIHQYVALPFLRGLFGDDVLEPVKLHVDAKRYLCHADAGYRDRLSEDSKRSLALQGGVFDADGAAAFLARPGAADAVALRRWDDLAKEAGLATPPLAHFLGRAARCARPTADAARP